MSKRVEKYTNWEGELNEIVHYSKSKVRGIDVLVNLVLSDFCGDTKNIETIFNPLYKYAGVRISNHDIYDLWVVIIYAQNIYSTLKTALYTNTHIDEELTFEKEVLSRNFSKKNDYHYSEFFPREHPRNKYNIFQYDTQRSRRRWRLSENEDGYSTLTVLRRESLERVPEYKNHGDPDYVYTNPENNKLWKVFYERPFKKEFWIDKGERTLRDTHPSFTRRTLAKGSNPELDDTSQFVSKTKQDIDWEVYYGNINEVSQFEVDVTHNYGNDRHYPAYKNKEKYIGIEDSASSSHSTPKHEVYNAKNIYSAVHTFRDEPKQKSKVNLEKSFRDDRKIEQVIEPPPTRSAYNVLKDYTRFSKISAVQGRPTVGLGRLSLFDDEVPLRTTKYRIEDENYVDSRYNSNQNNQDFYKLRRESDFVKEPLHVATNRLSTIPLDINSFTERNSLERSSRYTLANAARKGRVYDYPEYEEIEEEEEML